MIAPKSRRPFVLALAATLGPVLVGCGSNPTPVSQTVICYVQPGTMTGAAGAALPSAAHTRALLAAAHRVMLQAEHEVEVARKAQAEAEAELAKLRKEAEEEEDEDEASDGATGATGAAAEGTKDAGTTLVTDSVAADPYQGAVAGTLYAVPPEEQSAPTAKPAAKAQPAKKEAAKPVAKTEVAKPGTPQTDPAVWDAHAQVIQSIWSTAIQAAKEDRQRYRISRDEFLSRARAFHKVRELRLAELGPRPTEKRG